MQETFLCGAVLIIIAIDFKLNKRLGEEVRYLEKVRRWQDLEECGQ